MRIPVGFHLSSERIQLGFGTTTERIDFGFRDYQEHLVLPNIYDGDYVVDPDFYSKKLETNGKTMLYDVTVNAIMVSRTTNETGGKTVYIGGLLNG